MYIVPKEATMQLLSLFLLLLLLGTGGAHDQNSEKQILEVVATEPERVDDYVITSGILQKGIDSELSVNDAILNALVAFGINDTDLRPGQLLCPTSNLGSSYKRNRIIVGAVGCRLDPLIAQYTKEQKNALKGHHSDNVSLNCSDAVHVAGYFPPVPEYLITLWIAAQEINDDPEILPHHHICLQLAISPDISKLISTTLEDIIHSEIPVVIDIAPNSWLGVLQGLLIPHEVPLVRHTTNEMDFATTEELIKVFQERSRRDSNQQSEDVLQMLINQYLFSVGPDTTIPIKALCGLARELGWKHIGIIIANSDATQVDTQEVYFGNIRMVLVQYVESNPYVTFEALFKSEIKIMVYHGPPPSYLDVLKEALGYGFVGNDNVWIFPYHNVVFPEEYANVWCHYSNETIFKLKNALRGSLLLGISEGMGPEHEYFLTDFHEEAFRITGDDIYLHHQHFLQTPYIHDSLHVIADALHELVNGKAAKLNVTAEQIEIVAGDRSLLAHKLRNLAFYGGVTGNVSFTQFGRRLVSQVDLRNFVPIDNANFSVNTSLTEDPWKVQIRLCLEILTDGQVNLFYFDENGNRSEVPTIVFHDGTTNVPLDRPYRIFVRSNTRVILTTIISSLVFLVSVAGYATFIYFEDRKALLYNSNWIQREEDIDFLQEEQGIRGRLINVQALRSGFGKKGQENIARIKHGGAIVDVIKIDFDLEKNILTRKAYEEANLLMDLKHQNICTFHGCLFRKSRISLLFEHCTRGSLESILLRSDIQFDWIFKLSFALDAAQAMAFLHSKKIIHGRLSSSNCMINEEWTLKIQDYGLQSLRAVKDTWNSRKTLWNKTALKLRNLVHTDSQAGNTHTYGHVSKKTPRNKIAPEIRRLGDTGSPASDVYAYGHILEDLSVIKSLPAGTERSSRDRGMALPSIRPLRISTQGSFRNQESDKFIKLQQRCLKNEPQHRPSFEDIKIELRQMSKHFSTSKDNEHKGILQVYTRKLEEKVDWLSQLLRQEKEHSNDFMQNYLPRKLATAIQAGKNIPLSQQTNKTLLSLEMTNTELLLQHLSPEVAEKVIITMQKAIEGVTRSFHIQKLYSTGTTWILATVLQEGTASNPTSEAVNAAIAIIENFSGIFLPGLTDIMHPTLRLGLHAGDFTCGVLEDPVPQFVAYGENIEYTKHLMQASKDGKILASEAVAKELEKEQGFIVTYNKDTEFVNTTRATYWIEEDSNMQSNILAPSVAHADSRVTIKSRMRKSTVQRFTSTAPKISSMSTAPRRKSNPTPSLTSRPDTAIPTAAFLSPRGGGGGRGGGGPQNQRSESTSARSTTVVITHERTGRLGRTWSTVSEPHDISRVLIEEDSVFMA